jgi:hypothetical protein
MTKTITGMTKILQLLKIIAVVLNRIETKIKLKSTGEIKLDIFRKYCFKISD